VVLSIDAKRAARGWTAWSKGGREDTGLDAVAWAARAVKLGAGEILLNSIDADGTGMGYDLELTAAILEAASVPVIASGGAGTPEQIAGVLVNPGADAALVASLLHFGKTTLAAIKECARTAGLCIRGEGQRPRAGRYSC
jgi:cyclase